MVCLDRKSCGYLNKILDLDFHKGEKKKTTNKYQFLYQGSLEYFFLTGQCSQMYLYNYC